MISRNVLGLALVVGALGVGIAACSSSSSSGAAPTSDACILQVSPKGCGATNVAYYKCTGAAQPTGDAGACTSSTAGGFCCPLPAPDPVASGIVQDFTLPRTPIFKAAVDFGNGVTLLTNPNGTYSQRITGETPFFLAVSAAGFTPFIDQEQSLSGDGSLGPAGLVRTSKLTGLRAALPGYDSTKGLLAVGVTPSAACADPAGAIITLSDPAAGKIVYVKNGAPDSTLASVQTGETNPSAIVYDLDPATTATVGATHPTCAVAPFPYTAGAVSYSGKWKVVAGDSTSFFRIFLQ